MSFQQIYWNIVLTFTRSCEQSYYFTIQAGFFLYSKPKKVNELSSVRFQNPQIQFCLFEVKIDWKKRRKKLFGHFDTVILQSSNQLNAHIDND